MPRHDVVRGDDPGKQSNNWRDEVRTSDKYSAYPSKFSEMVIGFQLMSNVQSNRASKRKFSICQLGTLSCMAEDEEVEKTQNQKDASLRHNSSRAE